MENKKLKMDTQTVIILLMVGLVAGMLGGVVGVGGGIIIVPALVYFLGFSQHTAQGTSLGLIMLPVGILGFLQYYYSCQKADTPISFQVIGILAIAFVVGSFFGSKIALSVPQDILKKCFAILLVLVAVKMLFFDNHGSDHVTKTLTTVKNMSI
jgi:uncharacterized membrane protein YfcA